VKTVQKFAENIAVRLYKPEYREYIKEAVQYLNVFHCILSNLHNGLKVRMTKNFRYSKPALNCLRSTRQMACLNGSTAKSGDAAWSCTDGGNANAGGITKVTCLDGAGAIRAVTSSPAPCQDGNDAVMVTPGTACSNGVGSAHDADGKFCLVGGAFS
jgi:hypothetical protein